MKTINYLIGLIGVLSLVFVIYLQNKPIKPNIQYIKGDSVTIIETKVVKDTIKKYVYKSEIDTLTLNDTVYISNKASFNLGNSVVGTSGDVALVNDNFEFSNIVYRYPRITKTVVDTLKITVTNQERFSSGIQVGAGYGLINGKFDVFIGYGFQFKF